MSSRLTLRGAVTRRVRFICGFASPKRDRQVRSGSAFSGWPMRTPSLTALKKLTATQRTPHVEHPSICYLA